MVTSLPAAKVSCVRTGLDLNTATNWHFFAAAEFMFGPDWLAKPVTTYLQRSTWVYLPALPAGQNWVYHFNGTNYGPGPANLTLATPVGEFPLFYRNSLSQ